MSLLNDALRKKSREAKKTENLELMPRQPTAHKSRRPRLAMATGLLLLCGSLSLGAWYLWGSLIGQVDARVATRHATGQTPNPAADPQAEPIENAAPPLMALQPLANISPTAGWPEPASVQHAQEGLKSAPQKTSLPTTASVDKKPLKASKTDAPKDAMEKAASSPSQEKSLFFQKALHYHQQGQLHQAIQMYKQVLSVDSDYPAALLNLGAVYIQLAAFGDAYPLLKHLREIDRDNPDVLVNLAIVEIGLGRAADAIELLDLAASQYGEPQFGIFFHHAAALSQLGRLAEAHAFYKKAEELNPNHSSLIFNLALLADKLRRYEESVHYYRRFLQQNEMLPADEKYQIEARIRSLRAQPAAELDPLALRTDG
jgi:tetratricopeptide (TPR) repeat protein